MDVTAAVLRRRMVRAFTAEPIADEVLVHLCDLARRAPSAGNSQGLDLIVLASPAEVGRYWDVTLPEPKRSSFRWPGLVAAPALVVVAVRPDAYVGRYAEPDKAATGLGAGTEAWPVPYWWVDAGAAIEHLLLGAVEAGLGACLFGLFDHEAAVAQMLGVPGDRRLAATIALGHPAADVRGRSAARSRRSIEEIVHRGRW